MSGASRLMRTSKALQSDHTTTPSSSSHLARPSLGLPRRSSVEKTKSPLSCQGKKSMSASLEQTIVITPEEQKNKTKGAAELSSSLAGEAARAAAKLFGLSTKSVASRTSWALQAEMLIERGVVGCRSFTLVAIAGSLIGSILCFVEGCFLVMESFLQYFHAVSQRLDRGRIMQLLIDSIDMFLVGTALLTFGMGLYVMFVQSDKHRMPIAESSFFGLFSLKRLLECMDMQSISQAKSRIGHAVVLILQAGMLDKFKNVPLITGLDLTCFAGALLSASASVFLLSRLAMQPIDHN